MKAKLRSVRIAPKKVDLVAKMVRGMTVPDALTSLERTNKKAARFLERLLRSAVANASHNDRQRMQDLVIASLKVDKAQAYRRGVPMARGRVRPIRKFMSHVELTLSSQASELSSQTPKHPVQHRRTKGSSRKSAEDTASPKSKSS